MVTSAATTIERDGMSERKPYYGRHLLEGPDAKPTVWNFLEQKRTRARSKPTSTKRARLAIEKIEAQMQQRKTRRTA